MNGMMITVDENYDLNAIIPQLKAYTTGKWWYQSNLCREKECLRRQWTEKLHLWILVQKEKHCKSPNEKRMSVTVYPANTPAEEILGDQSGWHYAQQRTWRSENNALLLLKK